MNQLRIHKSKETIKLNNRFSLQSQWMHLMRDDSAVKEHLLSTFTHTKFSTLRREGTPNYDLLVEEA